MPQISSECSSSNVFETSRNVEKKKRVREMQENFNHYNA
jgi:hypothetical protein